MPRSAASVRFTALVVLGAGLFSCKPASHSDDDPPSVPFDHLPYIEWTSPANQASEVSLTPVIRARFSEAMDPASISTATCTLHLGPTQVAGDVALSPDGREVTFTPDAEFPWGSLFTARIHTTAKSATGQALPSMGFWTFMTRVYPYKSAEWQSPQSMDPAGGVPLNYSGPDIALDDSENACVVWVRIVGNVRRVYASRSVEGGAWSAPELITGSDGALSPAVTIYGSGQILVAWGSGTRLYASRASMTGAWSAPETAGDNLSWPPIPMELISDSTGRVTTIYYELRSGLTTDNVYALQYESSNGWLPRTIFPTYHTLDPSFAADSTGTIVVTWVPLSNVLDPFRVMARRFTPAGGWSQDLIVSPNVPTQPASMPYVTLDRNGNAAAVWLRRLAAADYDLFISRLPAGGTWSEPELVPVGTGPHPFEARVTLVPDGSAAVTWRDTNRCRGVLQDPQGAWTVQQELDPDLTGGFTNGWSIFSDIGSLSVIGADSSANPAIVWVNDYAPGTGWNGGTVIHTTALEEINEFHVVRDSWGRAAAVWKEYLSSASANNYVWTLRRR